VAKYLIDPDPKRRLVIRQSKLDAFRDQITELLDSDTHASAAVIPDMNILHMLEILK